MTGERTDFRLHPRTLIDRIAYLEDKIAEAIAVQSAAREEGRRQGWGEAVAALRDDERWLAFMMANDDALYDEDNLLAAQYLADQAPKEETHG